MDEEILIIIRREHPECFVSLIGVAICSRKVDWHTVVDADMICNCAIGHHAASFGDPCLIALR